MEIVNLFGLPAAALRKAAEVKEKIEKLQVELAALLHLRPASAPSKIRGAISAQGRARIAAAQKARWAKWKRGTASSDKPKARRKMSAGARKRLAEVAKARWAKVKAQGKSRL